MSLYFHCQAYLFKESNEVYWPVNSLGGAGLVYFPPIHLHCLEYREGLCFPLDLRSLTPDTGNNIFS